MLFHLHPGLDLPWKLSMLHNTVLQLRCTADGRHSIHSKRYKTKPTRSIQVHLADPTHHLLPFNRVAKKIQVPSAQQH